MTKSLSFMQKGSRAGCLCSMVGSQGLEPWTCLLYTSIGAGDMDAETLRGHIRRCKQLTDKPFGVNIMLMNPAAPDMARVVVEEGVSVVTTGAGNPGAYVPAWKQAGIKVFPVVAATILAKRLAGLGVDGVIAEGTESGGHVGEMTTMAPVSYTHLGRRVLYHESQHRQHVGVPHPRQLRSGPGAGSGRAGRVDGHFSGLGLSRHPVFHPL